MKIVHPEAGEIDFEELRQFTCEGKRNGWASGKKPIKFTDGSEGYKHVAGSLFYRDSYIGEGNFMGQEVVFFIRGLPVGNIPLWGMNYSDTFGVPKDFPQDEIGSFKKEVFGFLKEMLMQVPADMPFRGPVGEVERKVGKRTLTYINVPRSNFKRKEDYFREFEGHEAIRVAEPTRKGARAYNAFNFSYQGRLLVPDTRIQR